MPESLARAQQMTGGTLYFETVDIRNKDEIRNVFKKVKSDVRGRIWTFALRLYEWCSSTVLPGNI